jgi:hypothetical protein
VFSYLDANEDKHLLQFFNLKSEDFPKLIIYDFSQGKYFIDSYSYLEDKNAMIKLNELINNLEFNNVKWTTGYLIEDIFSNIGINISRNALLVILLTVITIFISFFAICLCNFMEKLNFNKKN